MELRGVRMSVSDDEDHERMMKARTGGCTSGALQSTGESEMDDVRKLSSETGQAAEKHTSPPDLDYAGLLRLLRLQPIEGKIFPDDFSLHPISAWDAKRACEYCIRWQRRALGRARDEWWDRLIDTNSPEERLSARRMIDGLNRVIGMQCTDGPERIRERESFEANLSDMLRQLKAQGENRSVSEDAAIDRWRQFGSAP